MYLDSNGQLTVTGNASGGAYITKSVDGTGDQEILRIEEFAATSNEKEELQYPFTIVQMPPILQKFLSTEKILRVIIVED